MPDARPSGEPEATDGHRATVGSLDVVRLLPRHGRRTVGAWCFVDHMGPRTVRVDEGIDIGPHPHTGLQTVTWLVAGEVLHRDSLGSEQTIRPGQLNLMTAGHGVAHSEEHTGRYAGELHGVQLWVAQPESTRHGPAAFEHHAELPRVELANAAATVLVGAYGAARSPARCDTDHVGLEIAARRGRTELELRPAHEHACCVLDGPASVAGVPLEPGRLLYLPPGRDALAVDAAGPVRLLVVGGVPFPEPVTMWWNFVARTRDEIAEARCDWMEGSERFGEVASGLARVPVGMPPWAG